MTIENKWVGLDGRTYGMSDGGNLFVLVNGKWVLVDHPLELKGGQP